MRNELHKALFKHLHEQTEQYGNDKEQLNRLYSLYRDTAETTLNALQDFADLIYWHGINEDSDNGKITASTLIGVGALLKNNLNMLDLSLYAKDKIGDSLYSLAQGGSNE